MNGWEIFVMFMLILGLACTILLAASVWFARKVEEDVVDQYGPIEDVVERWKNEGGADNER